jgi:hypothetical protein
MSRHSSILSVLAPTDYNSVNDRNTSNTIRIQGYGPRLAKGKISTGLLTWSSSVTLVSMIKGRQNLRKAEIIHSHKSYITYLLLIFNQLNSLCELSFLVVDLYIICPLRWDNPVLSFVHNVFDIGKIHTMYKEIFKK